MTTEIDIDIDIDIDTSMAWTVTTPNEMDG